jgi:preprotein translocase subunit SecE
MTDKKETQTNGIFQRIAGWFRKNFRETIGELKKVTWPGQKETLGATAVVLALVMLVSFYLGMVDLALSRLIKGIIG